MHDQATSSLAAHFLKRWQNKCKCNSFLTPIQGPELSSSEDTGAHNARPVEWKSTADSVPNHQTASLSKESIVPQRSQAVHDQPTLDDAHDKGGSSSSTVFLDIKAGCRVLTH